MCQFLTKEMPMGAKGAGGKSRTLWGQFEKIKEVPKASFNHSPVTPWPLLGLTSVLPGVSAVIVLRAPEPMQLQIPHLTMT